MILGYLVLKKRYTILQFVRNRALFCHVKLTALTQLSVCTVTAGVVLVTLSRTAPRTEEETSKVLSAEDLTRYFVGISMMTISLFCTGWLGLLQERTYTKYGPCWKEGVFYTARGFALYPLSSSILRSVLARPVASDLHISRQRREARDSKPVD